MKSVVITLALLLVPQSVPAQVRTTAGSAAASGITVSGRAAVRAPVKTVQFLAQARGNVDEAAVLNALRAAGIDDPIIGPAGGQLSLGNAGSTTLRGTVHDVSRAKLERIARAAADFIAAHPGVSLDNVQFTARADDCEVPEQGARSAALGEAHRKALAIAALAGVTLGEISVVNEIGGCPLANEQLGPQGFDLAALTVLVTVNETVTYAIAPGASTRRRPV